MKKRLVWADIIRILAIYFIIVLHVVSITHPLQTNFFFTIELTLADTCVPLLVMLSGALLLSKKESYSTFFRKRSSNVVIPWLIWTCIFTILSLFFEKQFGFGNIVHTFLSIFIPFFWFIVLICSLYLLTPAIRIFTQAAQVRDVLLIILLWFVAVTLLPFIRNTQAFPLYVDNGVVRLVINFIGYFLIGFLIVTIKPQKKYLLSVGIIFLLSLIGRSLLEYYSLHSKTPFYNGPDFIDPGLVIVSVSLFTEFYLLEDFFQRVLNRSVKHILVLVSDATLGIYFVHYIFLNRAPLPFLLPTTSVIHVSYNSDLFINALIFFIFSFIIIFLLQKIPFIKKLIS